MPKRGRPRGVILNRSAFEDLLAIRCLSRAEVARDADVSPAHLSELTSRAGRASAETVRKLAQLFEVQPGTLFPQLARFEPSDDIEAVA